MKKFKGIREIASFQFESPQTLEEICDRSDLNISFVLDGEEVGYNVRAEVRELTLVELVGFPEGDDTFISIRSWDEIEGLEFPFLYRCDDQDLTKDLWKDIKSVFKGKEVK